MLKKIFISLILVIYAATMAFAADKFVLVIDAGHGGHDSGAPGAKSLEKNINLKVALAFGKYVERNCSDVKVIYTRTTDVFVPLQERANIANRNKADLFISIHTNALDGGKISRGFETYTLGMHRAADNLNVAKRENSVILYEKNYKQTYAGFDPNSAESYIMFELMQDKNMSKSVELAKLIQSETCAHAGRVNKGVHQAGFLVLRETSMPSCLIELGFITTPDEEQFLNTEDGQDKMAKGIYNAFLKYKNKYGSKKVDTPSNNTTGNSKDAGKNSTPPKSNTPAKNTTPPKSNTPAKNTTPPKSNTPAKNTTPPKSNTPAKNTTPSKSNTPAKNTTPSKSNTPAKNTTPSKSNTPAKNSKSAKPNSADLLIDSDYQELEPVLQSPITADVIPPFEDFNSPTVSVDTTALYSQVEYVEGRQIRSHVVSSKNVPSFETVDQPLAQFEPNPEPQPQAQPKPTPETQPESKLEPQPQAQPKPNPEPQPQVQPKPTPEPQPQAQPKSEPQPQAQPNPEPQPQVQPKPTPEPQPQAQPKPTPEPQPQAQPKPTPEPQPQAQPKPTPEPQPQAQPKPKPTPEPQPQAQPKPTPEPQPQAQPKPTPQPQPQPQSPTNPISQQESGGRPIFKVQIAASSQLLAYDAPQFLGVQGVTSYEEGGMYKYTVGASPDFDEITALKTSVQAKFPQAFIVAFLDGNKINTGEAIREFKKHKANQ